MMMRTDGATWLVGRLTDAQLIFSSERYPETTWSFDFDFLLGVCNTASESGDDYDECDCSQHNRR